MSELLQIIRREQVRELAEYAKTKAFAEAVFRDWRNLYVAKLCAYIRLQDTAARRKVKLPVFRNRAWCNAAVHILTVADIEIQDRFLRATQGMKDRMVNAVLKDGGVFDLSESFVELPL